MNRGRVKYRNSVLETKIKEWIVLTELSFVFYKLQVHVKRSIVELVKDAAVVLFVELRVIFEGGILLPKVDKNDGVQTIFHIKTVYILDSF